MVYKKLFIRILFRVIILSLSCMLFAFIFYREYEESYFLITGVGLFILMQVYLLVKFVNKSNEDLALIFNAIQSKDSSIYFPVGDHPVDKNLRNALNRMITLIQSVETESEKRRIYLQMLIDQIEIGILTFDPEGNVELCNQAFRNMFHKMDINNIRELDDICAGFSNLLFEISPRTPLLKKLVINNPSPAFAQQILQLSIKATVIKTGHQTRKILTFHNIIHELEYNELDSWQKLIRVLTHEIMNSISPITSLSHKIASRFKKEGQQGTLYSKDINDDMIRKSIEGLTAIEETGKGLLEFVTNYRSLTLIPPPKIESFPIQPLFQRIKNLFEEDCISADITFQAAVIPENLKVLADESQIEKVMINLVKNAIEAVKENKVRKISLSATVREDDRTLIRVMDTGNGIPAEVIDDIFIPFYTTKEKGSGIGLSLSRQILRMNGGNITASSIPGKDTIFTIIL